MKTHILIERWSQNDFCSMDHEGCAEDAKEIVGVFSDMTVATAEKDACEAKASERYEEACRPTYEIETHEVR